MSDWLMVIITFVYTITTIFISVLNYKSYKVVKRQYHEDIRLRLMPCLYIELVKQKKKIPKRITIGTNLSNSDSIFGEFSFSLHNVGNGIAKEVRYRLSENTETDFSYRIISLPPQDRRDFILKIIHSKGALEKSQHFESKVEVFYNDLFDCVYLQTLEIVVCMNNGKMELETFYLTAPEYIRNTYTEKRSRVRRWLQDLRWWIRNIRRKIQNED